MTSPMQQPYGSQPRLSHPPHYPLPPPPPQGMVHPQGMVGPGPVDTQPGILGDGGLNVSGVPPASQTQPMQPPKDFNTALLCRIGQETVQEIVAKTTELFQLLKVLQLPNGTSQGLTGQEERKAKLQDGLRNIGLLFKRLKRIHEKCNENCSGMEYTHIEVASLVPMKDELDTRQEDKKVTENVKYLQEEHKDLVEQVALKNRQLKEIIDSLRSIIWDINTMLAMRKI